MRIQKDLSEQKITTLRVDVDFKISRWNSGDRRLIWAFYVLDWAFGNE